MTERERLVSLRKENREKIIALESENRDLLIQLLQVCDDKYWYKEDYEERTISKRPKKTERNLIGRRYWNQFFQDTSKPEGEGVWIERSQVVRVNGEWQVD